jgi:hypothetical protein
VEIISAEKQQVEMQFSRVIHGFSGPLFLD